MNIFESLIIVAIAALVHASFQLSISMLTLLSSHTIGAKHSHRRLLALTNAFTFGAFVMTILLLSNAVLLIQLILSPDNVVLTWVAGCGLLFGLGLAVWIFYYRKEQGTTLWVPRGMARYLSERTKATKQPAEAFGLGLSSVLAELLFIFVPIIISALLLSELEPVWQVIGIILYAALSLFPLFIITGLIGAGHKISRIQRWREDNKLFLQFIAGGGLIALGFYLYVSHVVGTAATLAVNGSIY